MEFIGDRIREIQLETEYNDEQLGRVAGLTKAAVGKWKNHNTVPGANSLFQIEKKLGYRSEWVLYGIEPKKVGRDEFLQKITPYAPLLTDEQKAVLVTVAQNFAAKNTE